MGNQKSSGKWYCILFCFSFCYFSSNCFYFFLKLLLLNHHTRGKLLLCPWICHCADYLDAVYWIYSASFQYKFCNTQTNKMNNSYLKNKKTIFFGNYGFWIFKSLIEIWPTKNWSNLRIHKRIFKFLSTCFVSCSEWYVNISYCYCVSVSFYITCNFCFVYVVAVLFSAYLFITTRSLCGRCL